MKISYASHGTRVPLSNGGHLSVTCLGVGSMLSPEGNTSFLAVKGKHHLLIDCGRTVPEALRSYGIGLAEIENVFLSHTHGDHIGGFTTLATANRYIGRQTGTKKLTVIAPRAFAGVLWKNCFSGDLGTHDSAGDPSEVSPDIWYDVAVPALVEDRSRETYAINVGSMHIQIFRTMHTPSTAASWRDSAWSTGIVINDDILITCDSRFDPELIEEFGGKVKAIVHDLSSTQSAVHSSVAEAVAYGPSATSKMWSSHHDPSFTHETLTGKGFAGMTVPGMRFMFEGKVTRERLLLPTADTVMAATMEAAVVLG